MTPQRTVGDDPTERVVVERYSDLAAKKRGLTSRQVDVIVAAFNEGIESAIVIEEWAADKDLPTAEGTRDVYLGRVTRETGKAWRFAAGEKAAFLPKSLTTRFDNALVEDVETPQRGLGDFAGGRP